MKAPTLEGKTSSSKEKGGIFLAQMGLKRENLSTCLEKPEKH